MANTSTEFTKLSAFFQKVSLPPSIELEPGTHIPDVAKFVENNLKVLGSGEMGEVAAAGRWYRMNKLKALLEKP
ncbi:MAG: hypothetical protein V4557_12570 [Bacteroidota bacterium]